MFTTVFWRDAFERALKTVAQALLALWVVGDVALNALEIDWTNSLGIALGAAVVSLLTSVTTAAVTSTPTASAVKEVEYVE